MDARGPLTRLRAQALNAMGDRWTGRVHVADDDGVLPTAFDGVSSTRMRRMIGDGKRVGHLVGDRVAAYMRQQRVAQKMRREEKWTSEERDLSPLWVEAGYDPPKRRRR